MIDKGKQAVIDLKQKTCGDFKYKTFLISRTDAIAILGYVEELEKRPAPVKIKGDEF